MSPRYCEGCGTKYDQTAGTMLISVHIRLIDKGPYRDITGIHLCHECSDRVKEVIREALRREDSDVPPSRHLAP